MRSFYRGAPSLNSDNRNAAAAKNVTRFAMPVMVADMLYYVGCYADITDNNTLEANRSAGQIAANRFSAVALALEHYADFGPQTDADARSVSRPPRQRRRPRKSLQINDVRIGRSRHP